MKRIQLLSIIFAAVGFIGCTESTFHEGKFFAGGQYVEAVDLNKGKTLYTEYCMACHGVKGDGKGVASQGMYPVPRDFTKGIFKFGKVVSGELPHDQDIIDIIKSGLHGTGMLPWDLSDKQSSQIVQYIKTFAPKVWEDKDKKLGESIKAGRDPYGVAHQESAIARGKEVFHVVAQCQSCHRAYATKDELNEMNQKINKAPYAFDQSIYSVKSQASEHGVKVVPPDFTWHIVRSAKTVDELYVRLSAGVGGTTMPAWKGTISDDDIWAVAHYVHYLMGLRDTPARNELMNKLK